MSEDWAVERPRCSVCGAGSAHQLFAGSDLLHHLTGEFHVVQCSECGFQFQWPRPPDDLMLYPPDYAGNRPATNLSASHFRSLSLGRRVRLLDSLHPEGGRLLDIGCGAGDFLAAAAQTGRWSVAGIEPSETAAQHAREVYGLRVIQGDHSMLSEYNTDSDIITMWHVLEHLPDPGQALRHARSMLAPSGHLVLAVPLVDSAEARLFGPAWAGYDLPRHLSMFSRQTLFRLCQAAGLNARAVGGVVFGLNSLNTSFHFWAWMHGHSPRAQKISKVLVPVTYLVTGSFLTSRASVGVFVANASAV